MARAYRSQGNPYGPLYTLASLLLLGCSIAILVIVSNDLWYGFYYFGRYRYAGTSLCFMQSDYNIYNVNVCRYAYVAAALGIFLSILLLVFQLCSGRYRRMPACELFLCLLAALWWTAFAITATVYGKRADDSNEEVLQDKHGYRTAVWALAWVQVGIWTICLLLSLKDWASMRGKPPPSEASMPAYPTGTYTQPVYQAPQGGPYGQQPQYYGAGTYPPPGNPPGAQTHYYNDAYEQPSPFSAAYPPPSHSRTSGKPQAAGYPPAASTATA